MVTVSLRESFGSCLLYSSTDTFCMTRELPCLPGVFISPPVGRMSSPPAFQLADLCLRGLSLLCSYNWYYNSQSISLSPSS